MHVDKYHACSYRLWRRGAFSRSAPNWRQSVRGCRRSMRSMRTRSTQQAAPFSSRRCASAHALSEYAHCISVNVQSPCSICCCAEGLIVFRILMSALQFDHCPLVTSRSTDWRSKSPQRWHQAACTYPSVTHSAYTCHLLCMAGLAAMLPTPAYVSASIRSLQGSAAGRGGAAAEGTRRAGTQGRGGRGGAGSRPDGDGDQPQMPER